MEPGGTLVLFSSRRCGTASAVLLAAEKRSRPEAEPARRNRIDWRPRIE